MLFQIQSGSAMFHGASIMNFLQGKQEYAIRMTICSKFNEMPKVSRTSWLYSIAFFTNCLDPYSSLLPQIMKAGVFLHFTGCHAQRVGLGMIKHLSTYGCQGYVCPLTVWHTHPHSHRDAPTAYSLPKQSSNMKHMTDTA